jgi:hypothetical protein
VNEEQSIALSSELMRIASVLRLHPGQPLTAFRKPETQLPLIYAALSENLGTTGPERCAQLGSFTITTGGGGITVLKFEIYSGFDIPASS